MIPRSGRLLFLHETHEVVGARETEFEDAVRERWLPAVARTEGARFLAFLHHAHGTGASYRVVTLTALRDGSTWAELVERVDAGDLRSEAERLDALRHDVTSKILVPLPWSPLQEVDLGPHSPTPGEKPALFMEDTVWPYEGRLEAYVGAAGSHYARSCCGSAWFAPKASFPCSRMRCRPATSAPVAGCTTLSSFGTAGRVGSCAARPGRPGPEPAASRLRFLRSQKKPHYRC